jgi:hypothetical protein
MRADAVGAMFLGEAEGACPAIQRKSFSGLFPEICNLLHFDVLLRNVYTRKQLDIL